MQALQAAGDPELQSKVAGPDEYLRAAAMARSPEMLDRAIQMQQAQGEPGWGLKAGQVIDFGNGVRGAAVSPNSVQIVGDDGQTYEIPEGGNYKYDEQGNIVITDAQGRPRKVKRGATENPMMAIMRALRPELFPQNSRTPGAGAGAGAPGQVPTYDPGTGRW
jgi:hypothetical protein